MGREPIPVPWVLVQTLRGIITFTVVVFFFSVTTKLPSLPLLTKYRSDYQCIRRQCKILVVRLLYFVNKFTKM